MVHPIYACAHLDGRVSSEHVFYIDTLLWTLCLDLFYIYLNVRIKRTGIPTRLEKLRASNFHDLSKGSKKYLVPRGAVGYIENERNISTIKGRTRQKRDVSSSLQGIHREVNFFRLEAEFHDQTCLEEVSSKKFSYISTFKKRKIKVDVMEKESVEMWHQDIEDSSKKILLYSRHLNVVCPI